MANKNTQRMYEISFHLIPTMDEKEAAEVYKRIKETIAKGGEMTNEENPVRQDLAYTIRHTVRQSDGSYNTYNEAYFGSVKFKTSRDFVKELHQKVRDNKDVLRFLILETVEEDTRVGETLPGTEENISDEGTEGGNDNKTKKTEKDTDKVNGDKK